jgi:hypothetical protein
MNKLEIKQGSFIQQTQYFIPDSRSGGNQCFPDRICPSDRHVWESMNMPGEGYSRNLLDI